MAEASDFKFGTQLGLGLPRPIIKSHPGKKWEWPWARGAPENFGVPYNISATAGAMDFKFGTQLRFANTHHKTTPIGKVGVAFGKGRFQIFGVSL